MAEFHYVRARVQRLDWRGSAALELAVVCVRGHFFKLVRAEIVQKQPQYARRALDVSHINQRANVVQCQPSKTFGHEKPAVRRQALYDCLRARKPYAVVARREILHVCNSPFQSGRRRALNKTRADSPNGKSACAMIYLPNGKCHQMTYFFMNSGMVSGSPLSEITKRRLRFSASVSS